MNQNNSKTEVMKLHDYIPFYVGATLHYGSGRFIIKGFHFTKSHADKLTVFVIDEDGDEDSLPIDENSRIELRALSDITNEEACEMNEFENKPTHGEPYPHTTKWARRIDYMLKKHFDIFKLIEAGLAIDATTLK